MLRLKEYLNNKKKVGGDLTVHGPFLWGQIASIRGGMPSMRYRTRWKFLSGCSRAVGKYPDMKVVVDGRHYLTPREAAAIVVLALWETGVGDLVDPEIGAESIGAEQIEGLFDRWMGELESQIDRGTVSKFSAEAIEVLKSIEVSQKMTYDILETSVNEPGKKPIPQSTLRGWVEAEGGKFRKGEICPLHIASAVWARAKQRRAETKSAAA